MNGYVFTGARLIAAVALVWALARHPIGYFTVLRFVTCAVTSYGAYLAFCASEKQLGLAFELQSPFRTNPLISFRMTRLTWEYVDVGVAIFLVASIFWFRTQTKNDQNRIVDE